MGYLLHVGATVICAHSGQAQATVPNMRVKVNNQQIVTQTEPFTVAGCKLTPQAGGPCATAQWTTAATRVKAGNMPVLLQDSQATCTPTGTPLTVVTTQTRVKGI
ncbi:protein of unknown function [Nitrosospira briensis]|uniref:DUF4280 domain-containing protein n=1 Tax=Nitrosospira briensis TaxID=35799 RepID=A0A1I4Y6S3_9PROT|nr:PAAR-like protein [Nitrosospira briensis]SFN33210.1 protein of unknown function [Nitrosospira briensis]